MTGYAHAFDGTPTYRNCFAFTCGSRCWDDNGGASNPTMYNCSDDDNTLNIGFFNKTLVNCRHNLVAMDELKAIVDTDSQYLRPIPSKVSIAASPDKVRGKEPLYVKFDSEVNYELGCRNIGENGIAPVYAGNTDISGDVRPGVDNLYSIGAHEMEINFV